MRVKVGVTVAGVLPGILSTIRLIFLSWTLGLIGKRLIFTGHFRFDQDTGRLATRLNNRRLTWKQFIGLRQYWRWYWYHLLLANISGSSRLAVGTL